MLNYLFILVIFITAPFSARAEHSYAAELQSLWSRPEFVGITNQDWATELIIGFECRRAFEDPVYPRFNNSLFARQQFVSRMLNTCLKERGSSPLALFLRPELAPRLYACVTKLCTALAMPVPMICAVNASGPAMKVVGNFQNTAVILINTQSLAYDDTATEGMIARLLISINEYAQGKAYLSSYGSAALGLICGAGSGALISYLLGDKEWIAPHVHAALIFNSGYLGMIIGSRVGTWLNKKRTLRHDHHAAELLQNTTPMADFLTQDAQVLVNTFVNYATTLEHYAAAIADAHPELAAQARNTAHAISTSSPTLPADVPSYKERLHHLGCHA